MAEDIEVLITELRVDMKRYEAAMRRQARITETTAKQVERRYQQMSRNIVASTDQMSRDVRRAIAAIALGAGAREVTKYADSWIDLNNKVKAAGESSGIQGRGILQLAEDAKAARSQIEPYVDLYSRILRAGAGLAKNEEEIAKATLITAKAFAAGGASATEQAAGVLQLGQALGSGFLQGDELRSLRENAPLVAKAIADAMGVSIGELKNLGAEGKLTSEVVFRALLNAEDSINSAFAVTVPRASDAAVLAFDNLKLKVGEYLQETGLVSKSSNMLADVLDFVSGNVGMFADALVVAGAALTGALGAQAVLSAVNGLNTISAGAATTSKSLALIRAASAFMFGPAGLIIGVGAAAAALAYLAIRGTDAQRAIKRLDEAQRGANDALRATSQYVDDDVIGKIGESAGQSVEPVSNLAGALKKVADALQDATIAQFLEDARKLQASITETQAAIADAEAKRARLQRQAVSNSGLGTQAMAAGGKATVSVDTSELDQEVGLARATLAGLERRQAAIGVSLFGDGAGKEFTDAILQGDVTKASEILRERLNAVKASNAPGGSGGGGGGDDDDQLKALDEIRSAYRNLFESEREQIARVRQERLDAIDASAKSEAEKAQLRTQANAIYQRELADIREQDEADFDAWMDRENEKIRVREEQAKAEQDLIADLMNRRDELAGMTLTVVEREYAARKKAIEDEIKDEERKAEALRILEEERAEYVRQTREELLGEGENSSDESERVRAAGEARLEALREGLELELITIEEFNQRKIELEQETEEELQRIRAESVQTQLAAGEQLFDGLAGLAKAFAGEQSGIYKALLAVEKAFAVASAIINIQQGVARALSLPFPANLGAAATVAGAGAKVIATLQNTGANFRDGGVDIRGPGTGRSDSIQANISRGESVITSAGTAANPNILKAINAGANVEAQIAAMSGGTSLSIGGTQLFVQGDVGTQETLNALYSQLDRRDAELADRVLAIMNREKVRTMPRHRR